MIQVVEKRWGGVVPPSTPKTLKFVAKLEHICGEGQALSVFFFYILLYYFIYVKIKTLYISSFIVFYVIHFTHG